MYRGRFYLSAIVFDLESNSVNYFNLFRTIWKVRIFERIPAIRNSDLKKKRHRSKTMTDK
jgi:hypothetical protein